MAYTVNQAPAHKQMPVGTEWIYTVASTNVGQYKFKYFVDVYISSDGTTFAVRLKFSPNSLGYGIVNFSDIFEQYVTSTNIGATTAPPSSFKQIANTQYQSCPIHLIDEASTSTDSAVMVNLLFGEEYSTNSTDAPTEYIFLAWVTSIFTWNAMAYNNEQIRVGNNPPAYGIDLTNWKQANINYSALIQNPQYPNYLLTGTSSNFLTLAPKGSTQNAPGQFIRMGDYHTMAILNGPLIQAHVKPTILAFQYFDSSGGYVGGNQVQLNYNSGFVDLSGASSISNANEAMIFLGVGTANIIGRGSFIPTNTSNYLVFMKNSNGALISAPMQFTLQDDDCRGYETIRLTWLNKFGAWDYYNFTKKNTRGSDIKRTEFNKIKGNWNKSFYVKNGYERGLTTLHTNITENLTLNSDWFTNDEEAAWLEGLFISPEVYILEQDIVTDTNPAEYGKYVTPVHIRNKKYQRYTRANDKVAQYEVDIEYSINKRVQRA